MAEQTKAYMHDRGTDRLRDAINRHEPTRAEVERAKAQSREIIQRLAARAREVVR